MILKDEAPGDAGFSGTKHLPVPGSKAWIYAALCGGREGEMKVKACSDFFREKGEGRKAPRPDPAPGGQRAEVLGVHPKEQKTFC